MQLIIHRGTKEIGGSCVELRTGNSRILIDLGIPLVDPQGKPFDSNTLKGKGIDELKALKILPDIAGLYKDEGEDKNKNKDKIDAILLSHSHLDHYGLLGNVNPGIPIYMSEGAKELIEITNIFTPQKVGELNTRIIPANKSFEIGDFKIFPYLVDHSAFDARAYLIEAEGKRLFYSGDFRGHGRKSVLFERMVKNPPKHIDCLLMEGSMLGREKPELKNEEGVQKEIERILNKAENMVFLSASSQNIDRIVSAYKACLKTSHVFVIDLYTAFILDRLKKISKNIPQFDWENIRVYIFHSHANSLVKAGFKDLLYKYNERRIKIEEINQIGAKILMMARGNSVFPKIIKKLKQPQGTIFIYSMWEGYLKDQFKQYCAANGIVIKQVHISGHAILDDLKRFDAALNPKELIPIHTFSPGNYKALFGDHVRLLKDGEKYDL